MSIVRVILGELRPRHRMQLGAVVVEPSALDPASGGPVVK